MRIAIGLTCLVLISCQSAPTRNERFPDAQALVEGTAARTPNIVRLTIHAIPTGESQCTYIASTALERVGRASDPEDIEAMRTRKTVVKAEGDHADVTVPMFDRMGRAMAVAGITLSNPDGASEQDLVSQAKVIARELSAAITNSGKPLW